MGKKPSDLEFVYETGVKFRCSVSTTPLRFMRKFGTNFWGMRFAIKSIGFHDFSAKRFIFEIGAGVW